VDRRPLGATGLAVSPIGFGAFKLGRNQGTKYAQRYELPDAAAVQRLIDGVLDLGINLVDTAPAYGVSEDRVGVALGQRRAEVVLSTKVGEEFADGVSTYDFSRDAVNASLERSLRRLRTDAVDLVLVHAHRDDAQILDATDVVETLARAKERGVTRLVGWSGKTVEAAHRALAWADVLMVEYHADDTSHAGVIEAARARGVGVLVKKALASGRLPAETALPFALARPGVSSAVVGGLSLENMRANVRIASAPDG
jgi:aryl-alcohol dehydrogenase-like predicted oxidoreductase